MYKYGKICENVIHLRKQHVKVCKNIECLWKGTENIMKGAGLHGREKGGWGNEWGERLCTIHMLFVLVEFCTMCRRQQTVLKELTTRS